MVENSLGRLWVEGHPNDDLKSTWKYYLDEAEQEDSVEAQLDTIRKEYAGIKPEEIKVIDPCMGSGHILCYMFDVLVQIYEAYGYTARDAASSIVENNIYGLDIDDRASQLAYFAVMMKARQYDRRFFSRGKKPNIYTIVESNSITTDVVDYFVNNDEVLKKEINTIIKEMRDAKEYGSMLNISMINFDLLYSRFDEIVDDVNLFRQVTLDELLPLVKVGQILATKYHIAITNPPYMTVSGMSNKAIDYIKKHYFDSKADLFAVFIEKCSSLVQNNGFQAMITMHSWMYLSSYEKLREKVLRLNLINMLHLGARAFEEIAGEVVQTTSFVIRKKDVPTYKTTYYRLTEPNTQNGKEQKFLNKEDCYIVSSENFAQIPGSPLAYNSSQAVFDSFKTGLPLDSIAASRQGLACGDVNKYRRSWFEVSFRDIGFKYCDTASFHRSGKKYVPINDGGEYRKWYGNNEPVLRFDETNYKVLLTIGNHLPSRERYFMPGITWTAISSNLSLRYFGDGFLFSNAGMAIFGEERKIKALCALLNSAIVKRILSSLNESINFNKGDIARLPILKEALDNDSIICKAEECIEIAKTDWDSFETSWDFVTHPFVKYANSLWDATAIGATMSKFYGRNIPMHNSPIELCYLLWQGECVERFAALKANEEELNNMLAEIYGLQNDLFTEVDEKDVSVRKANLVRDVRSFISYAVGCMFGRYSLNVEGIAYAGGEWNDEKYISFKADRDNVLPICDDEYFEDDIVGKFVKFVEVVYGKDGLEANLKFIADALGGSGSPRDVIRSYFLNDFYADHLKIYQKRPIYWQFDSGKKNGFKCLIYMHRYQPDTIARIRTDYVHEQQARYRTAIADLEQRIQVATTSERVKLTKLLQKLKDQETEIRLFEEKVHHLADQMLRIDLDDGVKHNYEIFKDVLTKLK